MNWNTADHPNATPTCISTPIIAVCVPPSSASRPHQRRRDTLKQPRDRGAVEERARQPENVPSTSAVSSPARTSRRIRLCSARSAPPPCTPPPASDS
jgi:hypothetical protein